MAAAQTVLRKGGQQEDKFTGSAASTRGNGGADSILFLGCFFAEITNTGYMSQGPEHLSPLPDPTRNLVEQLIPPDPAPRSRKRVLPSLEK